MARRSDTSLAALLLTQRLVETEAAPLKASEYWRVVGHVRDVAELLGRDAASLVAGIGVRAELAARIEQRMSAASSFAFALGDAEQSGMRLIASVDAEYPAALRERLGGGAPPLLYAVGDLSLLVEPMLGIVGSREAATGAGTTAKAAARVAVEAGWAVVSGAAKGVDRLAMQSALDAGGSAVGVLADSLAQTIRDADVRRAVTDGHLCLCTPYKPTAGFSVANAMGRNKVIYALSRGTLVVTADREKGGTWAGADEALARSIAPVLVWTGEGAGPGNEALVAHGASAVSDLSRLVEQSTSADAGRAQPAQLRLGV